MIDYIYLSNLIFWLLFRWGAPADIDESKFHPEPTPHPTPITDYRRNER